MPVEQAYIDALIRAPSESLSVELKGWLNPAKPEDVARIVKACVALRNNGGGFLILGFFNDGRPNVAGAPDNTDSRYHIDNIQSLVAKHASEAFEVYVRWSQRDGVSFPVIEIPSGVKSPVAIRSPLIVGRDCILPENRVYVRFLKSNNTPSTTEVTWRDWQRLVEICFENREADIARFIRRHLASVSESTLTDTLATLNITPMKRKTAEDIARDFLQESEEKFRTVESRRQVTLPPHGAWHVAAAVDGEVPVHSVNAAFLSLLMSNNPKYTGWPVWLDSRGLGTENEPYVDSGAWEAFIYTTGLFVELDFWRLEPAGRFYHRRAFQDDIASEGGVTPLTFLDFPLVIYRTTEAIAVALEFAHAMRAPSDVSTVAFAFKWDGLAGRRAASWAEPSRFLPPGYECVQDEVETSIVVPADTARSALGPIVHVVTQPLFEAFRGFTLKPEIVEDLARRVIERRW